MATNHPSSPSCPTPTQTHCVADDDPEEEAEEQYIDMEVSSSTSTSTSTSTSSPSATVSATATNCLCHCSDSSSPPHTREFEFQMSSSLSHDREAITSPADELFYKGKLLPLHLPPRLQMVQKLLQNTEHKLEESFEESYAIPLQSCNISPPESCRASSELNPDEYCFEWSSETNGFISEHQHPRKYQSWYKKLKQIKQSQLGQKIKASRAYLKSLFNKSGCSDESCTKAACNGETEEGVSRPKYCLSRYVKVGKKNYPFPQIDDDRYRMPNTLIKGIDKEIMAEDGVTSQRRSFSGAIKWHSAPKCSSSSTTSSTSSSSSSFSFSSSNGYYDLHLLKRSNSANSELESSIEGAIAHCKQSGSCLVQERLPVK